MNPKLTVEYKDIMRTVDNMMKRRGNLRKDYRMMHETYVEKLVNRMLHAEAGFLKDLETSFEAKKTALEEEYKAKRMELVKLKVDLYQKIELLELEISVLRQNHQNETSLNIKLEKSNI